jgi:hypothetical protein
MQNKKFIIFQFPNRYLWVMIFSGIISRFVTGKFHAFAYSVFIIATIIWSYEEITTGVNWFRKLLGVTVMLLIFVDLFRSFFI